MRRPGTAPLPVFPRVKSVSWRLRIGTGIGKRREIREFTSLSQMVRSLSSDPVPDHEWTTLERNGQLIYRGPWGDCAPH